MPIIASLNGSLRCEDQPHLRPASASWRGGRRGGVDPWAPRSRRSQRAGCDNCKGPIGTHGPPRHHRRSPPSVLSVLILRVCPEESCASDGSLYSKWSGSPGRPSLRSTRRSVWTESTSGEPTSTCATDARKNALVSSDDRRHLGPISFGVVERVLGTPEFWGRDCVRSCTLRLGADLVQ
jgi:hypothetical protein